MNLVSELSAWETELANLRAEVKILRDAKVLTDFELDQLRRRNALLEEKCEYHMTRHVRLKTQLDRTGADLVQAIQSINDDERREVSAIVHDIVHAPMPQASAISGAPKQQPLDVTNS